MTDTRTDTGAGAGRAGTTRPVLLAGIVLGTCLTILTMWDGGVRLRIPDIPSIIGAALGALVIWALFMAAASVLSELTVRHHRAAIRHGWRHSKRGGRAARRHAGAAYRGAASRSRPWRTRLLAELQARWAARGSEPLVSRRPITEPGPDPDPAASGSRDPEARVCAACGNPEGGKFGPLVTYQEKGGFINGTYLIHRAHFEDPATGYYGQPYNPGPGRAISVDPTTEGRNAMTEPTTRRPASRGTAASTGTAWKQLITDTSDFEPEDDSALLDWMAGEVNGMSAYAESVTDVYETGVSGIGLDPVSLAALHDYADSAAECAQAMAAARAKFASHYQEVREFAAAGGVLPHDGRWITGDGE